MPALPTLPKMPMGVAALESTDDGSTPSLPPLGMPPISVQPPATPPPAAGGAQVPTSQASPASAATAPQGGLPAVPYQTRTQPDGSVAAYIPSPDGNPAN